MRALWYRFEFRHRQPKQKGQTSCKPNMQFTLDKHLLRKWWKVYYQYLSSLDCKMEIWSSNIFHLSSSTNDNFCAMATTAPEAMLYSFLLWQKRHSWNPQGQGPKLQSVQVCCSFHLRPALRNGCWEGGLLGDTELLWQGLSSTSSASAAVT